MNAIKFLSFFVMQSVKLKCALCRKFRSGYTKLCLPIHSHYNRGTAADIFETIQNAQLAQLVAPVNTKDHEILYSEQGRHVLSVGFSLKSAHKCLY